MSRTLGALNTKPKKDTVTKAMRMPLDLLAWVDAHEGPNFSAKTIAILRTARDGEQAKKQARARS